MSAGVPSFFWLLIWGVIIAAVVCLAATFLGQITITPFARRPRPDDPAPPGVRIDRLDLTVPADPRVLRSIRQSLRRLASDIGLDAERSEALVVAAGEAVSNAIDPPPGSPCWDSAGGRSSGPRSVAARSGRGAPRPWAPADAGVYGRGGYRDHGRRHHSALDAFVAQGGVNRYLQRAQSHWRACDHDSGLKFDRLTPGGFAF